MMSGSQTSQSAGSVNVIDILTTDESKKYAPAGRMAAAIIKITHAQGGCLPQDLNAKSFTPDEVVRDWHLANAIAAVELRFMR